MKKYELLDAEITKMQLQNIPNLILLNRFSKKYTKGNFTQADKEKMREEVSQKVYGLYLANYHKFYEIELDSRKLEMPSLAEKYPEYYTDAINMLLAFAIYERIGFKPGLTEPHQLASFISENKIPYVYYGYSLKQYLKNNAVDERSIMMELHLLQMVNRREMTIEKMTPELEEIINQYHANYMNSIVYSKTNESDITKEELENIINRTSSSRIF